MEAINKLTDKWIINKLTGHSSHVINTTTWYWSASKISKYNNNYVQVLPAQAYLTARPSNFFRFGVMHLATLFRVWLSEDNGTFDDTRVLLYYACVQASMQIRAAARILYDHNDVMRVFAQWRTEHPSRTTYPTREYCCSVCRHNYLARSINSNYF